MRKKFHIIIIILLITSNLVLLFILFSNKKNVDYSKRNNFNNIKVKINEPNIMYKGIENHIRIVTNELDNKKLTIKIENGYTKYNSFSDTYSVFLDKRGKSIINVFYKEENAEEIKVYEDTIYVRDLPPPNPRISDKDTLSKEYLIKKGEIYCYNSIDGRSEQTFKIIQHTFVATINNNEMNIISNNEKFNDQQINLIKKLRTGQNLIIKDIKALMPDSSIRTLAPLVITIK